MSDVPFQHPGPVPQRPEVPEGVVPGPAPERPQPPESKDPREQEFRWWAPFVALLVVLVAATVIVGFAVVFINGGETRGDDDLPVGVIMAGTLLQALLFIGTAVLFGGLGGRRPTAWTFGLRPTRGFWKAVGWSLAAMGTFYLFSLVWAVVLDIDSSDDLAIDLGAKESTLNLIVVMVMVMLAAPIAEEFFFRGFFFPAVSNRVGWIGGALITGFVFGAIHAGGTEPEFLVPLMVFGFLLCLLYRFTNSLLPCIAVHAFNNATALAVTLEWEVWQGLLAVVLAPTLVTGLAKVATRRAPRPA